MRSVGGFVDPGNLFMSYIANNASDLNQYTVPKMR